MKTPLAASRNHSPRLFARVNFPPCATHWSSNCVPSFPETPAPCWARPIISEPPPRQLLPSWTPDHSCNQTPPPLPSLSSPSDIFQPPPLRLATGTAAAHHIRQSLAISQSSVETPCDTKNRLTSCLELVKSSTPSTLAPRSHGHPLTRPDQSTHMSTRQTRRQAAMAASNSADEAPVAAIEDSNGTPKTSDNAVLERSEATENIFLFWPNIIGMRAPAPQPQLAR